MNFHKVQNTIFEMLADRGFTKFPKKIESQYLEEDTESVFENDDTKVLVLYHPQDSVGVAFVKMCYQKLEEQNIKNLIIVKWGKLTPTAKTTIDEMNDHNIQVFDVEEISNNVTKHVLVPKHELLTKDETMTLLKKYRSVKTQLPRILKSDPVIRYYGWNKGDIVRIIRKSGEITYRCIV